MQRMMILLASVLPAPDSPGIKEILIQMCEASDDDDHDDDDNDNDDDDVGRYKDDRELNVPIIQKSQR